MRRVRTKWDDLLANDLSGREITFAETELTFQLPVISRLSLLFTTAICPNTRERFVAAAETTVADEAEIFRPWQLHNREMTAWTEYEIFIGDMYGEGNAVFAAP